MLIVEKAFPSGIVQKSHRLWWLTVTTDTKWLFLASVFCKVLSVCLTTLVVWQYFDIWQNQYNIVKLKKKKRKSSLDSKSPSIPKILYLTSNAGSPHSHHSYSHRFPSGALGSSLASHWGLGRAWSCTMEWVHFISLATFYFSGHFLGILGLVWFIPTSYR